MLTGASISSSDSSTSICALWRTIADELEPLATRARFAGRDAEDCVTAAGLCFRAGSGSLSSDWNPSLSSSSVGSLWRFLLAGWLCCTGFVFSLLLSFRSCCHASRISLVELPVGLASSSLLLLDDIFVTRDGPRCSDRENVDAACSTGSLADGFTAKSFLYALALDILVSISGEKQVLERRRATVLVVWAGLFLQLQYLGRAPSRR